ncbi:MAG: NAD-dependent epimerase/dehydratase family protein [Pirellulaceae bacterium]
MKTLVTGATGLLGNNVVRTLLDQGKHVRALVRRTSNSRPLEDLDVELITGDITDPASVEEAVKSTTGVIHCAGLVQIGSTNPAKHDQINHLGTVNVAEACQRLEIPLVHVSTVDALGIGAWDEPATETTARNGFEQCPYVKSNRAADRRICDLVKRGLTATIVYPGFMLGPWDWRPSSGKMLLSVAERWKPFAPAGGVSLCDVRDVALAIVTALEHLHVGKTICEIPSRYILAGENITYLEVWRLFARVSGGRGPIYWSGPLMRIAAGSWGDCWGKLTGNEPDVNSLAVRMSGQPHYFSSELAVRELNYRMSSAAEAAAAAWKWFVDNGYTHRSV